MRDALSIYLGLREDLSPAQLGELRTLVRAHYERLVAFQARNELVALDLAELLAKRLDDLLASAHVLGGGSRAEIVGAARYFVSTEDATPDIQSCTGLDDDVSVFNHAARAIGRHDLLIED